MASIPTVQEIRDNLEGYGVTQSIISDAWITLKRDKHVIPFVNRFIRNSILTEEDVTELYSGNGGQTLFLNRRYVNSLVEITLVTYVAYGYYLSIDSIELMQKDGTLKIKSYFTQSLPIQGCFPRGENNIRIRYKYGFNGVIPDDLKQAIIYLVNVEMLSLISSSTGGGNLSTQGFSRNYGELGKYTNYIKKLTNSAMSIMRDYTSVVVGA